MYKKINFLLNFGDIEEEYSSLKKSKVVILQVPYEATCTYIKGTRFGPNAIIEASRNMELFDEELGQETYKDFGIHTKESLVLNGLKPEAAVKIVERAVNFIINKNKFPVTLGGEHTISIGCVAAFKKKIKSFSVLQLDAHYDLRDSYLGSKYNHACVARRIVEYCPIIQVGQRSISLEEKDFLPNKNIFTLTNYDIINNKNWIDKALEYLQRNVYVTIDLDVLDPSIMPAVGTPEPGGLDWNDMLKLLKMLSAKKRIVGFDIVELCPIKGMVAPDFLTAKLIYRFLGYIAKNGGMS